MNYILNYFSSFITIITRSKIYKRWINTYLRIYFILNSINIRKGK